MKFTAVLQMPQLRRRLRDASWERWRKRKIFDLRTEGRLTEQGIKVVDANEFVKEDTAKFYSPDWRGLPDLQSNFPQPPQNNKSHQHWHDTPRLIFDNESFPIEGVKQAQIFSKSILKKGLPETLLEKSQSFKVPDQDYLAERVVKQAFLWDAYLEKLPNLRNFDFPTTVFRVKYGTPLKRSNEILMRNFLRLIESEKPELASSRVIAGEEEFRVTVSRHGSPVQIKLSPLLTIMSKKPLDPFMKKEDIVELDNHDLPSIFPFLSTAGIVDHNIYEENDFLSVSPNSTFPQIHTSMFSHHIPGSFTHIHPRWNDDRFAGTTIMYGFSTALLMARRLFGNDVLHLPEPVTTQVIHFTGKEFQFATFQLNTLDLEDSSKIKNIVWLTDKKYLFEKVENQLGKEILEGYNSEIFKIIMGMYCSTTK